MRKTTGIRLERYPPPPDVKLYLRRFFTLGNVYELPVQLARALVLEGLAVPVKVKSGKPPR